MHLCSSQKTESFPNHFILQFSIQFISKCCLKSFKCIFNLCTNSIVYCCCCCCLVVSVVFDSVLPHRRQPTRLRCPWDSPGKNTGVGCHFLLQCVKVKSESEVVQPCPTLSDPMDCSLPASSVHGIFQARVLEWGAIAFSQKTSRPKLNYIIFFIIFCPP